MTKNVRRLYEGFVPEQYQLFLDPNMATKKVQGTVTIIGLKKGRPSQRLSFHQHGLKIISATITKHDKKGDTHIEVSRINLQNKLDEVRLHTESQLHAGKYTVTLDFTAAIQDGMHGIYHADYQQDGTNKTVISTQLESHHAREAFPCIDEPEAKATFSLSLTVPDGNTALSNMPEKSSTQEDGKRVVTFDATPKMSTYLLAFVIGDLQSRETTTKDGVMVRTWSTKVHSPESLDFALGIGKRCIEFFNDYFGTPFPLPKSDNAAIPNFSAGAMENWGLITFREVALLAEPGQTGQSSQETIALVMCHELSHMWFGDLVTMKWWNDLWLNESFANMMEYVAVNALYPDWHIFNQFIAQEGLASFRRDAIPGVQAIKIEVHHPDEISTLFDPSIVYAKGGRLLNMLRTFIGEDNFRTGLQTYFKKHAYGNTTGDDLWAALGAATGSDVADFMTPWLTQPNFPVVTVDQEGTIVAITQEHFLLDPSKVDATRRWPIPLFATSNTIPKLLDKERIEITLPSADFVRINQGATGHYIVQYQNPTHAAAVAKQAASKTLSEGERLMLLSDSSLLAKSGRAGFAATLELLNHYANEDSEPVWDIMALIIADARRFIDADPALEEAIRLLVRRLLEQQYQRLGWKEQPSESSQDTKLRATILGLGVYSEHPKIVEEAIALFEAYKTEPSAVSAELRGIAFSAAVKFKNPGAFDWLLALEEQTTSPDLKHDILAALTITRDQDEAARLLARVTDDTKVRLQDVDYWIIYLVRNRYQQEQAWRWLRDNWGWIEKVFAGDKSYDIFPRVVASSFNTRARLDEYKAFFGPMESITFLARNIAMGVQEIEDRVAWIERDLPAVQKYFAA